MKTGSRRLGLYGLAAVLAFAGVASVSAVRAEDFAGDVPDRVWIDFGWSDNELGTSASFSGPNGVGAVIDFEDVFDIPGTKATGRMFGTARISEKRRWIDFGYVNMRREGSRQLDNDITWNGYTITAGSFVKAKFNTAFIYAAYRYDFLHLEPVRISGTAGLTWINFSTGLSANGTINNPDGSFFGSSYDRNGSVGAPVPMIGLNLDWALTHRLVVRSYTRFFRINMSSFNGSLNEAGMRLNWYFAKHFGLGLSYDRTDLDLKELKLDNENIVKANYYFNGASLFINLAF
jgi:hypothetical protein